MKIRVALEQDKGRKEGVVRDAIDRAAATARRLDEQKGNRPQSHEAVRSEMARIAERDSRRGKI